MECGFWDDGFEALFGFFMECSFFPDVGVCGALWFEGAGAGCAEGAVCVVSDAARACLGDGFADGGEVSVWDEGDELYVGVALDGEEGFEVCDGEFVCEDVVYAAGGYVEVCVCGEACDFCGDAVEAEFCVGIVGAEGC